MHLALHWDWVVRTTRRLFSTFPNRERVRWFVHLLVVLVMVWCVASGLLISREAMPALGWKPLGGAFWRGLHTTTADLTVLVVAVHVGLNWRWIVSVTKRLVRRPRSLSARSAAAVGPS